MRAFFIAACASLALATSAHADPSVSDYRTATGEAKADLDYYVSATAQAYLWANADAETKGRQPLYCAPARLALTSEQVQDILDRWLDRRPAALGPESDAYLALEVLLALQATFPCQTPPDAP